MALAKKAYRISRFGTVVLPQEIRRATFCLMRLQIQAVRGITYYSRERIPDQTVHGWITARNADGFVVKNDWDWRFDKQQWLLWELTDYQVTVNQCFIANKQTEVLLTELAKKPNTPPLPPSLPPVNYDSFFGRVPLIIHGFESITVKTRVNADFDIEFIYDTRETNNCSPVPTEIPRGPAPLENELPQPGGDNGIAPGPVFPPASLPPGSPPLGGTSKIPEGYSDADQSSPPNNQEFPPGATTTVYEMLALVSFDGFESNSCPTSPRVVASISTPSLVPASAFSNSVSVIDSGYRCGGTKYDVRLTGPGDSARVIEIFSAAPSFRVRYV